MTVVLSGKRQENGLLHTYSRFYTLRGITTTAVTSLKHTTNARVLGRTGYTKYSYSMIVSEGCGHAHHKLSNRLLSSSAHVTCRIL